MITQSIRRLALVAGAAALLTAIFASSAMAAPEAKTLTATSITATTATLNGEIDTGGYMANYVFAYGNTGTTYEKDNEYSNSSELGEIPAGSKGLVHVSMTIKGLKPNTTYHFRLAAIANNVGLIGKDASFTTDVRHAPRIEAEKYSATIAGSVNTPEAPIFSVTSTLVCKSANISSEMSAASTLLDVHAEYGECTFAGVAATVNMNSCYYKYNLANAGPPYTGSMWINCTKEGDAIEISAPKIGNCKLKIASQFPSKSSVSYQNEGEGNARKVRLVASASGFVVTKENPEKHVICTAQSSKASFGNDLTLKGLNASKEQIGLHVTGERVIGLYVTGVKSEKESLQPHIEGEQYPATIEGNVNTPEAPIFTMTSSLVCKSANISSEISGPTKFLNVHAEYGECTFAGVAATINMNSCYYAYEVANEGPPYNSGTVSIACAKEGDAIEIFAPGIGNCKMKIAAQAASKSSVSYLTEGEGNARKIHLTASASGFIFTKENPENHVLCTAQAPGTSKASFGNDVTLQAF